jgi:hypothetical protein
MNRQSVIKRLFLPLVLVIGFKLIAGFGYDLCSTLQPGFLKSVLINIFGPATFFSLWFFAFVGPPIAYYLGANFFERLIVAFVNPVIWVASVEARVACQFSAVEMMYFFFLPWTFGIMCVTCIEFSLSDLVCRIVHRLRGGAHVVIFHPAVLVIFVIGVAGTYLGLIKGQEWVYMLVHHYAENFL